VVVFAFRTTFYIVWKVRGETGGPQRRKSAWVVHEAQILPSPCPLTSTSSITRESVRHAPCPDSPSHRQKALKVILSTTPKLEVIPILLHCRRTQEQIVGRCKLLSTAASLPFRMLMPAPYP
jgi:hypothetical protein